MSPRSEEFLVQAQERLAGARASLRDGFVSTGVSSAYYAMLYAARAALSEEGRYAKTHGGTWNLFHETFVVSGRFDAQLAADAQSTQHDRQRSDYDAVVPSFDSAQALIELAERFVAEVGKLIGA